MLVKMKVVLVKIAVMMMAPDAVPAPPEARGREPPFFFFYLDGRRVSPLVLGSHGLGGARAPPRLDLSLYFCVLKFYPFTVSFIFGDP